VNPTHQQFVVASGQICPANAPCEKHVATKKNLVICRVKTEASRTVSRHKKYAKRDFAKLNFGCLLDQEIGLNRFRFQKKPEILEKLRVGDKWNSISMIRNLTIKSSLNLRGIIDMVDVAVSDQEQVESYRQITQPIRRPRRSINKDVSTRDLNEIRVRIKNTPNKRLKVKHSE
jgi:hypothetical protein